MLRAQEIAAIVLATGGVTLGQSSSLFLRARSQRAVEAAATTQPAGNGALRTNAGAAAEARPQRNEGLIGVSLTSFVLPEPPQIQVNDLVGVIVRHRLNYESTSRLNNRSRWDVDSKLSAWFRFHDRKWVQQDFEGGTPAIEFENQNNQRNDGRFDREDVFETRVEAKIIDIKPNGNLVLAAWQRVNIDKEDQYIRLTGECNKIDIGANRTITSDKIFGLEVETFNKGAVTDATKRGWFKEFTDRFKPF